MYWVSLQGKTLLPRGANSLSTPQISDDTYNPVEVKGNGTADLHAFGSH